MPEAARTIVKSPPELWAEVSDPESLARHLGEAGEIKITRLDPESTVVWEGDRIRGTVDLAPAGWGTKVTVTAEEVEGVAVAPPAEEQQLEPEGPAEPDPEPQAAVEPEPEPEVEPDPEVEPEPEQRRGFFARFFRRRDVVVEHAERDPEPEVEPDPEPVALVVSEPEPESEPDPEPTGPDTEAVLDGMLGSLGAAHHRPFSR